MNTLTTRNESGYPNCFRNILLSCFRYIWKYAENTKSRRPPGQRGPIIALHCKTRTTDYYYRIPRLGTKEVPSISMQRTRYGDKRFAIANKRNFDDRRTCVMLNRGNPSSSDFLQQRGIQVMMMMLLAEYRGHQKIAGCGGQTIRSSSSQLYPKRFSSINESFVLRHENGINNGVRGSTSSSPPEYNTPTKHQTQPAEVPYIAVYSIPPLAGRVTGHR